MNGEMIPYTNFHDLNLDWIIKTMQELKDKEFDLDYIATQAEEIKERIEELDGLDEEFDEIRTQFDEIQTEFMQERRPLSNIICLTDSYGTNDPGYDRYSWCDILKDRLALDSDHYLKLFYSGASFGDDDSQKNLNSIFQTGTANMSTERKDSISDIIIVAGINEWNEDREIMYNSMVALNTYIRDNFPHADIWLFAVQWDKQANIRYATFGNPSGNTYTYYRTYALTLGWNFVMNVSAMVYSGSFVDDVHPTTSGSRMIASIVKSSIEGHPITYNTGNITNVQIETSSNTRRAGGIYFDGNQFVWSASPFTCDALPDLPSGFNGMIKLGNIITSAIIGCDYANIANPVNIPCTLGLYNGTWHNVPGTASIRMNNGQAELWFRNNGSFDEIPTPGYSNISDSYLYFGSTSIPIWD